MNEYGDEVDRAAGQAWVRFQARLADRLAAMEQDDVLVVEELAGGDDEAGADPYVQFCAWGPGLLRGEVAGNHVLRVSRELDAQGERALLELGYDAPTYDPDAPEDEADSGSLNFYVDVEQAEADRLAVMSVRALRDVFGVPHPALLTGGLVDEAEVPVEPAAFERGDEPVASYPHGGHEELTALVDRALTPYFGHEPEHDDDGDIPVDLGDNVLFVRVNENTPVVELFACVARDVTDRERAMFEIDVLNREVRFVKFRLAGDAVLAELHLPSWPFVPEHLRAMLAVMGDVILQVEDDLVRRVGGRRPGDDDAAPEDAEETGGVEGHPDGPCQVAGRVLAQLEAEAPGSVSPEVAASVCHHDVELILDLIDREQAPERVSLLRRALRVVVERAARDDGEPAKPSVDRRRPRTRSPRPRRVPDPTIEEVDPEIWT